MEQKIQQILKELYDIETTVVLTRPDSKFGDWSTNVALQLAKSLVKNPRDIAEEVAESLRQSGEFSEVSVAGPGFINLRLNDNSLIEAIYAHPQKPLAEKKIVLEYSCPNAFKELHTGHLYQTIFGDVLARVMEIGGAKLHRVSFGGDVGLHVAKCLYGVRQELGSEDPAKLALIPDNAFERAQWISKCYVTGATAYEQGGEIKAEIDNLNKTIYGFHTESDHTSPLAQIYWMTRQWSFDYFDAFYKLIDVAPLRYYPESETAEPGIKVVNEQLAAGKLKKSDGAVIFEGDKSKKLHTRVFMTSQGLPTYEAKDIGVIWMEKDEYNFDHRYLLTGNDQTEYMKVVYAAAEAFRPELAGKMTHLTNGTVRFADGKKMSSRLGNVSRAVDVINIVRERVADFTTDKSLHDAVALGAVKYAFARYKLGGDINFNIDETVSLHGNSGPYIQYAHARARRILEKADTEPMKPERLYEEDYPLVRKLGEYHEVIDLAVSQLEPHRICNYLYELAQEFNRYYEKNRVIGSDKESHRVNLVALYADTLKAGLDILGIAAPERL